LREKWKKLERAENLDFLYEKPKKVFHTVLSESFQQKLKRAFEMKFNSRDISSMKKHMTEEVIQTIDENDWEVSPFKLRKRKESQEKMFTESS
jgi:hypothetical protein